MTKEQSDFLIALEKAIGITQAALENTGVSRPKFLLWYNTNEEFANRVNQIQDKQIDFVESKLLERINKGDTTAITFYLKTKGKERGYTDKAQNEVEREVIININALQSPPTQEVVDIPMIEIKNEEPKKNGKHTTKRKTD